MTPQGYRIRFQCLEETEPAEFTPQTPVTSLPLLGRPITLHRSVQHAPVAGTITDVRPEHIDIDPSLPGQWQAYIRLSNVTYPSDSRPPMV